MNSIDINIFNMKKYISIINFIKYNMIDPKYLKITYNKFII